MLRSRSPADALDNRAYGGFSRPQRERALNGPCPHDQALKLAGGTEGCVVRAASEFERIAIAGSLWKFEKPIRTSTARRAADRPSPLES